MDFLYKVGVFYETWGKFSWIIITSIGIHAPYIYYDLKFELCRWVCLENNIPILFFWKLELWGRSRFVLHFILTHIFFIVDFLFMIFIFFMKLLVLVTPFYLFFYDGLLLDTASFVFYKTYYLIKCRIFLFVFLVVAPALFRASSLNKACHFLKDFVASP